MKIADMLPKLETWHAAMVEMDRQYDALNALAGISPDSPLAEAIFRLEAMATKAMAESVGDSGGWLDYYWLECNMGNGLRAGVHGSATISGKQYPIRTLKQLARVIVADNKQESKS